MTSPATGIRHVFAFEGRGGFPAWAVPGEPTAPRRRRSAQGNLILDRGRCSLAQVLNYWHDIVQAVGECRWHYYAQNHWRRALADVLRIATSERRDPIALLGYSNGGDAAYQVARALGNRGISVDLVVTADPVRKPLRGIGLLGFRRPDNVAAWHNIYQRCDRKTLGGWCPIVGHDVAGADTDKRLTAEDFAGALDPAIAHLWIPAHPLVVESITQPLRRLGREA